MAHIQKMCTAKWLSAPLGHISPLAFGGSGKYLWYEMRHVRLNQALLDDVCAELIISDLFNMGQNLPSLISNPLFLR